MLLGCTREMFSYCSRAIHQQQSALSFGNTTLPIPLYLYYTIFAASSSDAAITTVSHLGGQVCYGGECREMLISLKPSRRGAMWSLYVCTLQAPSLATVCSSLRSCLHARVPLKQGSPEPSSCITALCGLGHPILSTKWNHSFSPGL